MLRIESLEAVTSLSNKAGQAGLSIVPLPNTPLALALQQSYSPILDDVQSLDIYFIAQQLHAASTRMDQGGNYPHDDAMAILAAMVSDSVQKNLQLARTIVIPQVKSIVEVVESELGKAEMKTINPIAIVPDYLNSVWASPTLDALVERYEESAAENIPAPQWFPAATGDLVMDLIKSGSGGFDADIAIWAGAMGVDFFMEVYRVIFAQNLPGEPALASIYEYMDNKFERTSTVLRNRALAIFLMARKLQKEAPEAANMGVAEYRAKMAKIIEQSGRYIAQALKRRRSDIKQNVMVPFWPGEARTALAVGAIVTVVGEVYDQFIAKGGSPEIVLGAFMSDKQQDPDQLLANAERYRSSWNRNLVVLKSQAAAGRYNAVIKGLLLGTQGVIDQLKDEELVVLNKGVLIKRLHEVTSTLSSSDIEDLYASARTVLCYTLYAHTDVEKLLKAIDKIMGDTPDLDVREGALYAVIEMMADWLLKLVDVRISPIPNGPTGANEKAACALATLGTAVELGTTVIEQIAGNDISNRVEGEEATPSVLATALALKIQNKLQHLLP